jgi:hypothetical protein
MQTLAPLLPLHRQRQQYLQCARVEMVDPLKTDGQITLRACGRESESVKWMGRQPVTVAGNVDDRICSPQSTSGVISIAVRSPVNQAKTFIQSFWRVFPALSGLSASSLKHSPGD